MTVWEGRDDDKGPNNTGPQVCVFFLFQFFSVLNNNFRCCTYVQRAGYVFSSFFFGLTCVHYFFKTGQMILGKVEMDGLPFLFLFFADLNM